MKAIPLKILFIAFIITISISGCSLPNGQISPTNSPASSPVVKSNTPPVATMAPIGISLSLTPAPKLGETAELTYIVNIRDDALGYFGQSLANAKAWIDFEWTNIQGSYTEAKHSIQIPLSETAVSGNMTWQGNALANRNIKAIDCQIRLPREGVWKINTHLSVLSGDTWKQIHSAYLQVGVAEGTAAIITGSREFYSSQLGYMGNYPYGNVPDRTLNETSDPILLMLNISKAPKVGEESILTCRITSLHDIADFPTTITFTKWQKATTGTEVPGNDLLVKGDLAWRGSLKSGQSVEFSSTIKFPEEGDWLIHGQGNILTTNIGNNAFSNEIRMTINRDRGSYGWKSYPQPSFNITIPGVPVPAFTK
jgi:hypothetical protein